jgi:hypothetical protein
MCNTCQDSFVFFEVCLCSSHVVVRLPETSDATECPAASSDIAMITSVCQAYGWVSSHLHCDWQESLRNTNDLGLSFLRGSEAHYHGITLLRLADKYHTVCLVGIELHVVARGRRLFSFLCCRLGFN